PVAPEAAMAAPATISDPGDSATTVSAASDPPLRSRTDTIKMPAQTSIGAPPAMPAMPMPAMPAVQAAQKDAPVSPEMDVNRAEDPTHMPGPREIPAGRPEDPAAPPGQVPPGDSRSMRRRTDVYEFALIYRIQTYVISRFGVVGTRGQWRVVEYPTSASASHAYAKECSRFVSDGFSDYRERGGI